jgi:hypothetical protein
VDWQASVALERQICEFGEEKAFCVFDDFEVLIF